MVDLPRVAEAARSAGAALMIDASQSCGAMPLDVSEIRPDFLVAVGYKWLLGPFGLGYMYVDERHHGGEPIEQNWINRAGSEDFARLVDYRDEYQSGARRFDVGQRTNFELLPMAIAALEQLASWRVDRVAATLADVTHAIAAAATTLGLGPLPAGQRGPHLLGVRLPDSIRADVVASLAAVDCYAAVRGETLRIAPHLHVTDADVDRLIDALATGVSRRSLAE
jgi:selenocysteine lyase/cysteine desulfurase